ncbi:hypothetical protein JW962_00850 [Candidatus Dojkabacteria bacterium]|nr:hypothetical protein [Candidatus Dojkabacteria bacterium]
MDFRESEDFWNEVVNRASKLSLCFFSTVIIGVAGLAIYEAFCMSDKCNEFVGWIMRLIK